MISAASRNASKLLLINGSARVNGNTSKLLKEIGRGFESRGGKSQMINLGSLNYKGCSSCLQCKKNEVSKYCLINDDLKKIWSKVDEADAIAMGFPIYMGLVNGNYMSFIERLIFPSFSYIDYQQHYDKKKKVEIVVTMGAPLEAYYNDYKNVVSKMTEPLKGMFGDVETIVAALTPLSLNKNYVVGRDSVEERKKLLDTIFPKYIKQAFNAGERLNSK